MSSRRSGDEEIDEDFEGSSEGQQVEEVEATFSKRRDKLYYEYLRSHDGGCKSVAEAKYSVVIADSFLVFAEAQVGCYCSVIHYVLKYSVVIADSFLVFAEAQVGDEDTRGYPIEDHCLACTHLYCPWLKSLTKLSVASKRSWCSRLCRFIKYRSSRGCALNPQRAAVFQALCQAKEKLLAMQSTLRDEIREEYAQTQSLEALTEKKQWTSFDKILRVHYEQKDVFFQIINSQAKTPRSQMSLTTRTWCLGFVVTSLYVLLSSARRKRIFVTSPELYQLIN